MKNTIKSNYVSVPVSEEEETLLRSFTQGMTNGTGGDLTEAEQRLVYAFLRGLRS